MCQTAVLGLMTNQYSLSVCVLEHRLTSNRQLLKGSGNERANVSRFLYLGLEGDDGQDSESHHSTMGRKKTKTFATQHSGLANQNENFYGAQPPQLRG